MTSSYIPTTELNMRCAGVKRLLKEACELRDPTELFYAKPMEDNLFEWHFTVRGPPDSPYDGGVYHGRIVLPPEYPMKPPNLILLTPNGRWAEGQKICLSISGYHPETWLPSWSIRTALLAMVGFMPTHSVGAIGGLDCSDEERKRLAKRSLDWRCEVCNCAMREIQLKDFNAANSSGILQEMRTATSQQQEASTGTKSGPMSATPQAKDVVNATPAPTPVNATNSLGTIDTGEPSATPTESHPVTEVPTTNRNDGRIVDRTNIGVSAPALSTSLSASGDANSPTRRFDPTLIVILTFIVALLALLLRRFTTI